MLDVIAESKKPTRFRRNIDENFPFRESLPDISADDDDEVRYLERLLGTIDGDYIDTPYVAEMIQKSNLAQNFDEKLAENDENSDFHEIWCHYFPILHFARIDFHQLVLVFKNDLKSLVFSVSEFQFHFLTFNPEFVKLLVWLRFIFLVIAFLLSVSFTN